MKFGLQEKSNCKTKTTVSNFRSKRHLLYHCRYLLPAVNWCVQCNCHTVTNPFRNKANAN